MQMLFVGMSDICSYMVNANVKHNPNPNPNPNPNLNPYPTLNQKPNHYHHSNSMLLEILSQEQQLSPEQISDHRLYTGASIHFSDSGGGARVRKISN